MVAVRKKHIISNRAIMITKMKLERVSNPSMWANCSRGSGKIATTIKRSGRRSQVTELLIDIKFLRRLKSIKKRSTRAAIDTSIRMLVMLIPS